MKRLLATFMFALATFPSFVHAQIETDQLTLDGPLFDDSLEDVHTIRVIGDYTFLVDHIDRGSYEEKRLYRQSTENPNAVGLVFAAEGNLDADDDMIEFNDALYFTLTTADGITLYQSTDDGTTWEEKKTFTVKDTAISLKDLIITPQRLYVIAQSTTTTPTSLIAVLSTSNGDDWHKKVLRKHNPQYVATQILEDTPYLFANLSYTTGTEEAPMTKYRSVVYSPLTPNGKKFIPAGLGNYNGNLPIKSVQEVVSFNDTLFISGYINPSLDAESLTKRSNWRTLRSTNGVVWRSAGGKFTDFVNHQSTLFTHDKNQVYYTTTGETFTPINFSFESEIDMVDHSLTLFGSADTGLLFASMQENSTNSDDEATVVDRCLVSRDAVTWFDDDCMIADKAAPRQVSKFDSFWYFVRGRNQTSYNLYSLTFNK
ncbi:MAG: hypothetical protein HYV32_05480 [Candidatus Kerfeldbacteria bacterium]|nr:hypothetical protein [Candidatus Kerfeldbacteria bacterium]